MAGRDKHYEEKQSGKTIWRVKGWEGTAQEQSKPSCRRAIQVET